MTTQLDFSVGMGKETTYGVAATATRFFEAEAKMKLSISRVQGKGLRPTKNVNRLSRSSVSRYEVSGDQQVEALTSGLGYLIKAVMGSVTSTVIPTATPAAYQQVHTLSDNDPVASYTIQEVLPMLGGTGIGVHTFTGCVAESLDIEAKEGAVVTAKISWLGKDATHGGTPAAASYPASDAMFTFVHGAIVHGGTLVAPTTTAVASLTGGTAAINIVDFSLSIKNNLDTGGFNLGGAGKRSRVNALGVRAISGKITAEFSDEILRTAFTSQTPLPIVLTFAHDVAMATVASVNIYPTIQIVLPSVILKGELPTSNGGAPVTMSLDFDAYDNGTAAEPIWVTYRTLDTAV
jgi:hypothetical protein